MAFYGRLVTLHDEKRLIQLSTHDYTIMWDVGEFDARPFSPPQIAPQKSVGRRKRRRKKVGSFFLSLGKSQQRRRRRGGATNYTPNTPSPPPQYTVVVQYFFTSFFFFFISRVYEDLSAPPLPSSSHFGWRQGLFVRTPILLHLICLQATCINSQYEYKEGQK